MIMPSRQAQPGVSARSRSTVNPTVPEAKLSTEPAVDVEDWPGLCRSARIPALTIQTRHGRRHRGDQESDRRGAGPGPRIYPSQAAISQTCGHGDFGFSYERPTALGGNESRAEQIGFVRVADGAASLYDPLYIVQFTTAELRAAVQAADDYGTYVDPGRVAGRADDAAAGRIAGPRQPDFGRCVPGGKR